MDQGLAPAAAACVTVGPGAAATGQHGDDRDGSMGLEDNSQAVVQDGGSFIHTIHDTSGFN